MINIKFDVWDRQTNELLTGDEMVLESIECPLNGIFEDLRYRFVFLRYSGMPDNTGKEIREGHVILGPDEIKRIVTYKPGAFVAILPGETESGIYLSSLFSKCQIIAGEDSLPEYFPMGNY